jgi:hypothetical protein
MAGLGTLNEVRNTWDLADLFDANELLFKKQALEAEAMQRAKQKGR